MRVFAGLPTIAVILRFGRIAEGALSTIVESGEEVCFSVRPPAGGASMVSGNFECLDDDAPPGPVGAVLYDEHMTPVWSSKPGASEGHFAIHGRGKLSLKYELCFQNGRLGSDDAYAPKDGIDREIGFALRITSPSRELEDEAGPDNRLTAHLLEMSDQLRDGLTSMADHQDYMKEREQHHMMLAFHTIDRLVQWTVLEAAVLVLISLGQVLYLKKFFEQRRYL